MRPGIKVGLRDWQSTLSQVKPACLEVWFRLDWARKYQPLFAYLNAKKIPFGLHFWAMIKGKYFPNLLYLDRKIAEATFMAIKATIKLAGKNKAYYVNFHPESYRLSLLDLDKENILTLNQDKPVNREASFQQLLFYLEKINQFAKKQGVVPFLETVPKYSMTDFHDIQAGRLEPQKTEGLETKRFVQLAQLGFPICLDLAHTMGQLITDDKTRLTAFLYETTKKLAANIGLIHVNTLVPPFNGTDSHDGVTDQDFARGVIPGKQELLELLRLFKDKDVWLVPEPPMGTAVVNYMALTKLVEEV